MMKRPFAILACCVLMSCDIFAPDMELDGEYDVIIGLVTPDSLRESPHEVFVGRLTPSSASPRPPIGTDRVVNRCLFGIRIRYNPRITPRTNAQVAIRSETGETVTLRHVGNGYYRDEQNALRIEHQRTYFLEVRYDGKTYTAKTTVPGRFGFTNIRNGDTLRVLPDERGDFFTILNYTNPIGRRFFWRTGVDSNLPGEAKGGSMELWLQVPFYFYMPIGNPATLIRTERRIMAVDTSFGNLFEPALDDPDAQFLYGSGGAWGEWYDRQTQKSIQERSNIQGPGRVAGVFGSYSLAKVFFFARRGDVVNISSNLQNSEQP
jgi:hypothetical protein